MKYLKKLFVSLFSLFLVAMGFCDSGCFWSDKCSVVVVLFLCFCLFVIVTQNLKKMSVSLASLPLADVDFCDN